MFKKVLIANRGEIAVRIIRSLKVMDIATVAIHSDVEENAMHVKLADESVCVGPAQSSLSYLNMNAIISAALLTNAEAIHPGVGFLAENELFARIVKDHKLTFIGPSAKHIALMGDKISAKNYAQKLGLPILPSSDNLENIASAKAFAKSIDYPVLLKAACGGGGKGIAVAYNDDELSAAFSRVKREAKASFGDDKIFIEKYLKDAKHIEVQVLGDGKGKCARTDRPGGASSAAAAR